MTQPVRFGVIGVGVIGPHHAKSIAHLLKGQAELVAVADVSPERAQKVAGEFGARAYKDYREMLANREIDAVAVCTPSGMHATHALDVLAAGKHLVVEKPVDITLPAIDRLIEAWRKSDRVVTVISQHRFASAVQTVRQLASEGRFGKVVHADATMKWFRSQAYYDSGDWRGTWALDGGGCMMNQGVHTIDLLQWVMHPHAGRVVALTAYTGTLAHERIEVEDSAVAILRFENGGLGALNFTTNAYPGLSTRLEVHGIKGTAVLENEKLKFLNFQREATGTAGHYGGNSSNFADEYNQDGPAQGADGASADPTKIVDRHTLQYVDFITCIREGRRNTMNTPEDARRPVEIILACYESSRSGKEVRLG